MTFTYYKEYKEYANTETWHDGGVGDISLIYLTRDHSLGALGIIDNCIDDEEQVTT